MEKEKIRQAVRENYGQIATSVTRGCGCTPSQSCCDIDDTSATVKDTAIELGYSSQDVRGVPEGANMGLGCGNPVVLASLKENETVLDLGSGGGFDCFLAAGQVGPSGKVIGVDMTPEMISKARKNAVKAGSKNVEFRLGEIEYLPLADHSVDVIISNCVINLSPEKRKVFKEAFRVLKHGGRLAVSDMVATAQVPNKVKEDFALYARCLAGAVTIDELEDILKESGFTDIRIKPKDESRKMIREWAPGRKIEDYVVSAVIEATKP
jgi:ubiquinone/menaquinone biosynthesis C-methylase UbiE